jgi:hypothetical protein
MAERRDELEVDWEIKDESLRLLDGPDPCWKINEMNLNPSSIDKSGKTKLVSHEGFK